MKKMPESMKEAIRKDRDLWVEVYMQELNNDFNNAKADAKATLAANKHLELIGTVIFPDGSKMNDYWVNEALKQSI
jgi:hypothetical protein